MELTPARSDKTHILTVTMEDYFHGPAFSKVISKKRWGHLETRFEPNCFDVLDRLDEASARATFFVNSWIARKRPTVVREVIRRGHEVALAGQRGVSFRHLTRASLREQVGRDRDIVEQQTSRKVLGFRVTDVLLGPKDLWALDELTELGFRYDSSLSPFLRNFQKDARREYIHEHVGPAGSLWEVPLSSGHIGGCLIPFAGGNYFRQFPEWLIKKFLAAGREDALHPLVLYFRLWDFDSSQPRLQTGSLIRDFRHYRNGERMIRMMSELLAEMRFTSIADYLALDMPVIASEAARRAEVFTPSVTSRLAKNATPVSVIVPCYNEAEGISFLSSNLNALKAELEPEYDVEFVLVDDGSSDQTWDLLQSAFGNNPAARLIRHEKNKGVSAAIMTGLSQSRDVACSIDCDCSYDPSELKPMLGLLGPDVDLVTASPYHPRGAVLNVPGWRLLLSRASSQLYRLVTGRKLHTFTACVRVYRRASAVDVPLKYSGFLGVAELLGRMALENKKIVEHPATLEVRIFGQSKMKVARTIIGHLRLLSELAMLRFRARPGAAPAVRFPVAESIEAKIEKS